MNISIEEFEKRVENILEGERLKNPPDYLLAKGLKQYREMIQKRNEGVSILEKIKTIVAHIHPEQEIKLQTALRNNKGLAAESVGRLFYKIPDGEIAIEFLSDNLVGEILFDDNRCKKGLLVSLIDEDSGEIVKQTQTDGDGFFEFLEVSTGTYLLRIQLAEDKEIIIEHIKKGGNTDVDEF